MHFNDLKLVDLRPGSTWRVTFNGLLQLEPDEAGFVELPPDVEDIWQAFSEDLMQAENQEEELFVDVGWTRCASPSGRFVLRVLPYRRNDVSGVHEIDWLHPLHRFETRSLRILSEKLREVMK